MVRYFQHIICLLLLFSFLLIRIIFVIVFLGELINAAELQTVLDEYENWLWDFQDAGLEELQGQVRQSLFRK